MLRDREYSRAFVETNVHPCSSVFIRVRPATPMPRRVQPRSMAIIRRSQANDHPIEKRVIIWHG